jgi:2-desacetyl-2-hydroxyethyl bacteriochlorophyllide A dehydrogenase
MNKMKAVVLHSPQDAVVEIVEKPDAGDDDVIVRVGACGLCGTDLKIFSGEYLSPYPLIPGHELAGTIVSVGSHVDSTLIGQRVAVDPTLACGHCEFCQDAQFNHCESWGAIGDTVNGGFAEFTRVPIANVYRIKDDMPFNLAALVEPVSCAVWALERMRIRPGSIALIFGAGPMGLILMKLLENAGVMRATVVDTSVERLTVARNHGAHDVLQSDTVSHLQDLAPKGFDLVVDATGNPNVLSIALPWVRKAGQLLLFGVSPQGAMAMVEPYLIYHNEITILSSMAINHSYGRALNIVETCSNDFRSLITHELPLSDYVKAIGMVKEGKGIKLQLTMDTLG